MAIGGLWQCRSGRRDRCGYSSWWTARGGGVVGAAGGATAGGVVLGGRVARPLLARWGR